MAAIAADTKATTIAYSMRFCPLMFLRIIAAAPTYSYLAIIYVKVPFQKGLLAMIKDKQSMPYKIRGVNLADLKIRVIFRRYLTQDPMPALIADIQGIDIVRGLP